MDQQITPSAAAVRAFASARQQFLNALDNLDAQAGFLTGIIEQYEVSNIDEYNQAVELNEALNQQLANQQGLIDALNLEISDLKEKQGEFECRALDAEKQAARIQRLQLAEKAIAGETARQLNELKTLNPVRLKEDNKEKRKLLDKQRLELRTLREEITSLKRNNVALEKETNRLLEMLTKADRDITRLNKTNTITDIHRRTLDKAFFAEEAPNKPFYAYLLTDAGNQTTAPYLVNDLDWKLHIMNCYGEGVVVMFTEWLYPQLPPGKVGESVPYCLIEALIDFGMQALSLTHPHLIERVVWAQGIPLDDIGLTEKQLSLLASGNIFTLHHLMSLHEAELAKQKGLGEKSAKTIMDIATNYISQHYHAQPIQEAAA